MSLYLVLQLVSDTCLAGSGGGRVGSVDTDLERDPTSDLPIVRGRTLKGLLVEELAQLLRVLEPAATGPWHAAAATLFGTRDQSRGGGLAFHDGELPADLRAAVAARRWHPSEVLEALTTVRSQTMMDVESGAPQPHSLRSARLLRAGLSLRAEVLSSVELDSAQRALLAACTAAVRRAGLHRNHGWGEVRLRLHNGGGRDLTAEWLAGLRRAPSPSTARMTKVPESTTPAGQAGDTTSERRVLSYRLPLKAPAVLAVTGADGSSVETLPYISGSTVLGALAWRWLERNRAIADPAASPDFRRLFLDGSVRFLNAYATAGDRSRLLPCPNSLTRRKGESSPVFDRAGAGFEPLRQNEPDNQWQSPHTPFVQLQESLPGPDDEDDLPANASEEASYRLIWRAPDRHPRLHHTRDDREAGRSTDGALFSYISIDAGEVLAGHILCDQAADAAVIRSLLTAGPLPLGRARTAGYGGWAAAELDETSAANWCEAPPRRWHSDAEGGRIVVTLLSD